MAKKKKGKKTVHRSKVSYQSAFSCRSAFVRLSSVSVNDENQKSKPNSLTFEIGMKWNGKTFWNEWKRTIGIERSDTETTPLRLSFITSSKEKVSYVLNQIRSILSRFGIEFYVSMCFCVFNVQIHLPFCVCLCVCVCVFVNWIKLCCRFIKNQPQKKHYSVTTLSIYMD